MWGLRVDAKNQVQLRDLFLVQLWVNGGYEPERSFLSREVCNRAGRFGREGSSCSHPVTV